MQINLTIESPLGISCPIACCVVVNHRIVYSRVNDNQKVSLKEGNVEIIAPVPTDARRVLHLDDYDCRIKILQ